MKINEKNTVKQSAVYRAKRAYDLWIMNGIATCNFAHYGEGYVFQDVATGYFIYLKINGALRRTEKQNDT